MKNALIVLLLVTGLANLTTSCKTDATDQELEQMCDHLVVLRGEEKVKSVQDKCIADARKEGVSQRQALCRISAVNKSEYWVRCRTGKAR
ncbi:MAG: hypothetical protein GY854_10085 [Deltaproteobacteria bacterium]|nr:hypothetical protein [Deltaproteobacteria bacterium]